MDLFVPPLNPDVGMRRDVSYRVHAAKFGDGYSQRAEAVNGKDQQLSLSWGLLTFEQADSIEQFFDGKAGAEAFLYAPPNFSAGPIPWTCGALSRTDTSVSAALEMTITRVFDVGVWSGNVGGGGEGSGGSSVIRKTAVQWQLDNTVLPNGTHGIEVDTDLFKIGDGGTAWNDLHYLRSPTELGGTAGFQRRSSAAWVALNPILSHQILGYEDDTNLAKLGDGFNRWIDLPYLAAYPPDIVGTEFDALEGGGIVNRPDPQVLFDGSISAGRDAVDVDVDAGASAIRSS